LAGWESAKMKRTKKNASIYFLARKYLGGDSRMGIKKTHLLTLLGIALGVMALITVSSVMNGFREDIRQRIIGTLSEMRLSAVDNEPFADYATVVSALQQRGYRAAPVVRAELLLKHGAMTAPAVVFGIDPALQKEMSPILQAQNEYGSLQGIVAGSFDPVSFNQRGIALGSGLASDLGIYVGDEIQVISPIFTEPGPFGLMPRVRVLQVKAIFAAGMPEYDQSFAYIPLSVAQDFNSYQDRVDYIEIRSDNPQQSIRHSRELNNQFPGFKIDDWSSFDASLYGAIRFEKFLMFVILLFMFIIASFNLTGSLLKLISQKKQELGLLKALGYEDHELRRLFLAQAMMLCTLGFILGALLSTVLLILQDRFGIVKLDQAIILPVQMQLSDFLVVGGVSYLLTWLSVLMPLNYLKKINAVELIRRNA